MKEETNPIVELSTKIVALSEKLSSDNREQLERINYLEEEKYDLNDKLDSCIEDYEKLKNKKEIEYQFVVAKGNIHFFANGFLDIKNFINNISYRQYFKDIISVYVEEPFSVFKTTFNDMSDVRSFFRYCDQNSIIIYETSEFED